jgi:ParB family chromosome partitioning protein
VKPGAIAIHSSASVEHYTPAHVVELARAVMGVIDLDPASCEKAQRTVKAGSYIALPHDGLALTWGQPDRPSCVFLNPPGGVNATLRDRWGTKSCATAWWRKLTEEHRAGRVTQAIFVGFNLEILRTAQGGSWPHPFHFPICVPEDRLRFGGLPQPTHANVIVGVGVEPQRFASLMGQIGAVKL